MSYEGSFGKCSTLFCLKLFITGWGVFWENLSHDWSRQRWRGKLANNIIFMLQEKFTDPTKHLRSGKILFLLTLWQHAFLDSVFYQFFVVQSNDVQTFKIRFSFVDLIALGIVPPDWIESARNLNNRIMNASRGFIFWSRTPFVDVNCVPGMHCKLWLINLASDMCCVQ